jgi:hypothetical protein
VEGVNASMIYLILCKNLCECYNVPSPSTTIKKEEEEEEEKKKTKKLGVAGLVGKASNLELNLICEFPLSTVPRSCCSEKVYKRSISKLLQCQGWCIYIKVGNRVRLLVLFLLRERLHFHKSISIFAKTRRNISLMAIRSLVLGCFDSAKESKSLKF